MKMENLNKTQIVLLTLLTSFVTSIATGIVTVTLMDQAPAGVTQTINRVVERTIETVVPGENQVTTVVKEVIVKEEDLVANAVEKLFPSLVEIRAIDSEGAEVPLGMGVVISGDGYIVTDKNRIEGNRNNLIVVSSGKVADVNVVSDKDSEVAILKLKTPDKANTKIGGDTTTTGDETIPEKERLSLVPASLSDSDKAKLGQAVVSFTGDMGDTVLTGIISKLNKKTITSENENGEEVQNEVLDYIISSIDISKKSAGGPLLDTSGNVLGINTITSEGVVVTTPINTIKEILFSISDAQLGNIEAKDLTKSE